MRSALDQERYACVIHSPELDELFGAAMTLLHGLVPGARSQPPSADEAAAWQRRYTAATAHLADAGPHVRADTAAGSEACLKLRSAWQWQLHDLARLMLYEWDDIGCSLNWTLLLQAGRQAAWMRRLSTGSGSFTISRLCAECEEVISFHSRKRTAATASPKVGSALAYHTAARGMMAAPAMIPLGHSVTNENSTSRAGVVCAIAGYRRCNPSASR